MGRRIQQITISIVLVLSGVLLASLLTDQYFPDRFSLELGREELSSFSLVNSFTNSVLAYKPGLFFDLSLKLLGPGLALGLALGIWAAGLFSLTLGRGARTIEAILLSFCGIVLVVFVTGLDTAILSSICFAPWFVYLVLNLRKKNFPFALIGSVLFAIEAQIWSIPLFALIWAMIYFESKIVDSRIKQVLTLGGLSSLVVTILAPSAPAFDYPAHARVMRDWAMVPRVDPLVGVAPSIDSIAWEALGHFLWLWLCSTALLLIFGLVWNRRALLLPLLISFSALIDLSNFAVIGPFHAISRIVPNLIFYPLVSFTPAILILILAKLKINRCGIFSNGLMLITLVLAAAQTQLRPLASVDSAFSTSELVSSLKSNPEIKPVLLSPSLALAKNIGPDLLKQVVSDLHSAVSIQDLHARITASAQPEMLRKLETENIDGRWTAGGGKQDGSEWLLIKFRKTLNVSGVVLDNPNYSSDYPRGIAIYKSSSCGKTPDSGDFSLVLSKNPWTGSLLATSSGLPYLGHESHVSLPFDSTISTQCLLIRQTGQAGFDWSVESIKIALAT